MTKELDELLLHFGIKGMRWGIRRDREGSNKQPGYKIYDDGRIEIAAGEKMQRLVVGSSGTGISKDYAYMSFLPKDNAQYIYKMAPNTTAKGSDLKRDTMLTLKTKHNLKSPSLDEAQRINVEVMTKNADELRAYSKAVRENKKFSLSKEADSYFNMMMHETEEFDNLASYMRTKEMDIEFDNLRKKGMTEVFSELTYHPEKYPAFTYAIANRHIANDDPDITPFKKDLLGTIESKGYNMLRDETDIRTGLWTSPVIVLKPEKNIEVTLSKKITSRTLKQSQRYIEKGKHEFDTYVKNG